MKPCAGVDEDLVFRIKNMVVEALAAARSLDMAQEVTRQSLQWAGRLIEGFESVNPLPKPIACQLGCTFCCHNEVEVTPPEVFFIAQVIRYDSLSLKIAKYPLHQIIGLRAESMLPCDVISLFLLAFHLLSLSVGATLGF